MFRTRVGYAGGLTKNPTYYNLSDHSETIQIEYDPTQISYQELLGIFWDSHNPALKSFSSQYASKIFYHNEEQKRLATESKEREEARINGKIYTEIVPAAGFYQAEDYHQKYYLRGLPGIQEELQRVYPRTEDFIASTAVARINGYAGGYGTAQGLQEQLSSLGLSAAGNNKLLEIGGKSLIPGCAVP